MNRHRLGNLCLTRQNQKLHSRAWAEKLKLYQSDNATLSERELINFEIDKQWTEASIKSREVELAKFFVSRWNIGLDTESTVVLPKSLEGQGAGCILGELVEVVRSKEAVEKGQSDEFADEVCPSDSSELEED